jgi:hypothetical protein
MANTTFGDFLNAGKSFNFEDKAQCNVKDILGKEITIKDFTIMTSTKYGNETCACIADELPNLYFFAPSVLTKTLKRINANETMMEALRNEGLKVKLSEKRNKQGTQTYIDVEILN